MSTVLVTGASRYLGARVARALPDVPGVGRVIGIDAVEPRYPLDDVEYVRTDLRNPLLGRILTRADVDIVLHLGLTEPRTRRERAATKEHNVIGTMMLLAAAQARPRVRRIVLKSTAGVYGSSPKDPAVITEKHEARGGRLSGYARDVLDVEGYLRAAERRRPDLAACVLRMAHVVGPDVTSVMTDYLRSPFAPVPIGYDGRIQVLHADDAVAALVTATLSEATGAINVADPGVVGLRQAVRLAGGTPVPVVASTGRLLGGLARRARLVDLADDDIDHLLWGRALDLTRMRDDLPFQPAFTTREALPTLDRGGAASPHGPLGIVTRAARNGLAHGAMGAARDLTTRLDPTFGPSTGSPDGRGGNRCSA